LQDIHLKGVFLKIPNRLRYIEVPGILLD